MRNYESETLPDFEKKKDSQHDVFYLGENHKTPFGILFPT